MKSFIVILTLALGGLFAPLAMAQNHAEVGVFADYYHDRQTATDFAGVGGRVGVNIAKPIQLEAEMNYDFNRVFSEGFQDTETSSVTFVRSNIRVLHGLFGPKLQTTGPVRLFVTAKGGFINYRFDAAPPSFDGFVSSVSNLRANNVNAVFYPGAGVEGFLGPVGLRLEVGDEMYFDRGGVHQGLRVTSGPSLRF